MRARLVSIFLLALAGCSQTNIADLVLAMGKDPANVCVHINAGLYTPAVTVARVNGQNVSVQCEQGTLTTIPAPGAGVATIQVPVRIMTAP